MAKAHSDNDPKYYELIRVPIFLEDLAWVHNEGLIEVDALFRRFSLTIEWEWRMWQPTVTWIRGEVPICCSTVLRP